MRAVYTETKRQAASAVLPFSPLSAKKGYAYETEPEIPHPHHKG